MNVYVIKVDSPLENETFSYLNKHISKDKAERILRQKVKQNSDCMLIGEILAMYAIKADFGVPFKKQRFRLGEFGKPYLFGFDNIHFNVSHSEEYVVCAVGDTPVGIDVQKMAPYNCDIAKRAFTSEEINQIEKSENKSREFTKQWTHKEAYLKMIGVGFAGIAYEKRNIIYENTTWIEDYCISICCGNGK